MDQTHTHPVIIIGAGISGLATAWYLKKADIPFILFEKEEHTGGLIRSESQGGAVLDFGPNTIRDKSGEVRQLVEELGLSEELLTASEAFKTRYLVRDHELKKISPNPVSLLGSDILSTRAKFRMASEAFISSADVSEDESVGAFFERRLGKEAVDYIIDPVFSGIYAGNIYELSKQALLPALAKYEEEWGSLTWGAIRSQKSKSEVKPKVLSFRKGIQQLTHSLKAAVAGHIIHEEVVSLRKENNDFLISTAKDSYIARQVISTVPAYRLAEILKNFDPDLTDTLSSISYAPILSTQVIYNHAELDKELPQGFGFLVPRIEGLRLLGAIWKSTIFPEQTSGAKTHFTLMTGGDSDHTVKSESINNIEEEILNEFSSLMNINTPPELVKSVLWEQAIPQFKVGYPAKQKVLRQAGTSYPGLYIGGNYSWGISVPDCIQGAKSCSERIRAKH